MVSGTDTAKNEGRCPTYLTKAETLLSFQTSPKLIGDAHWCFPIHILSIHIAVFIAGKVWILQKAKRQIKSKVCPPPILCSAEQWWLTRSLLCSVHTSLPEQNLPKTNLRIIVSAESTIPIIFCKHAFLRDALCKGVRPYAGSIALSNLYINNTHIYTYTYINTIYIHKYIIYI